MHGKTNVCCANCQLKCIKSCECGYLDKEYMLQKILCSRHAFAEPKVGTEADSCNEEVNKKVSVYIKLSAS